MEGGKDTISAEVPGEDRSYGVWDQAKEKGVVLSEAIKPSELKMAQAYFNRNADADMDYEDIVNMLTSEDFSEEIANEIALNAGRKAPKKVVEHGGFPRKGSVAYNIAMKRKEEENKPANIKKTEKIGDKNHMVGTAKVVHVEEGKEENIAKLRKDYKDAKGWVEMSRSDRERRGHEATVQKIWNHAKTQYKIDLDRKDGKLDEGFSPYKIGAKVKIVSGPKDCIGKVGFIGEIRTGPAGDSPKTFTIDYDHDEKSTQPNFGMKSVQLKAKDIKLVKSSKE
jgi:hypothetical protein